MELSILTLLIFCLDIRDHYTLPLASFLISTFTDDFRTGVVGSAFQTEVLIASLII